MNDIYSRRLSNTEKISNRYERNRVCKQEQNSCTHWSIFSSKKVAVQPTNCEGNALRHSEVGDILTVFPVGVILPTSCQDPHTSDSQNSAFHGAHQNLRFNQLQYFSQQRRTICKRCVDFRSRSRHTAATLYLLGKNSGFTKTTKVVVSNKHSLVTLRH